MEKHSANSVSKQSYNCNYLSIVALFLFHIFIVGCLYFGTAKGGKELVELMVRQLHILQPQDRNSFLELCVAKRRKCSDRQFSGPDAIFSWRPGISKKSKERFWGTYECVYKNKIQQCPVDGAWTEWSAWSKCKANCEDRGFQVRNRACLNPRPQFGGDECDGRSSKSRACIGLCRNNANGRAEAKQYIDQTQRVFPELKFMCIKRHCFYKDVLRVIKDKSKVDKYWSSIICVKYDGPCPVNGGWSSWTGWSQCSVRCGAGERFRKRNCNRPTTKNGGIFCQGAWVERVRCISKKCQTYEYFSDWSPWSPCSLSCGNWGFKTKVIACLLQKLCQWNGKWVSEIVKSVPCYGGECPRSGAWGQWGSWTGCSAKCATGRRARLRHCSDPPPTGGETCPGPNIYVENCDGSFCLQVVEESRRKKKGKRKGKRAAPMTPWPSGNCARINDFQDYQKVYTDEDKIKFTPCQILAPATVIQRHRMPHQQADRFPSHPAETSIIKSLLRDENYDNDSIKQTHNAGDTQLKLIPLTQPAKSVHEAMRGLDESSSLKKSGMNTSFESARRSSSYLVFGSELSLGSNATLINNGLVNTDLQNRQKRRARNWLFRRPKVDEDDPFNLPFNPDLEILYSGWSQWTSCTKSCGGGKRHRRRQCKNRKSLCKGEVSPTQFCNVDPCPVFGGWSSWLSWTPCSATCAWGKTERFRKCDNPLPAFGGNCPGSFVQSRRCHQGKCPDTKHGRNPWTLWSACSSSCGGGSRVRYRTIRSAPRRVKRKGANNRRRNRNRSRYRSYYYSPPPWRPPPPPPVERKRTYTEKTICNYLPCPERGSWAAWGGWSRCSLPCGLGVTFRDRTCTDPAPVFGGKPCEGQGTDIQTCFAGPCVDEDDYGVLLRGVGYLKYAELGKTTHFLMVYMRIKLLRAKGVLFHHTSNCRNKDILDDCELSILASLSGSLVLLEAKTAANRRPLRLLSRIHLKIQKWQDIIIMVTESWASMRLNDGEHLTRRFPNKQKLLQNFDGVLTIGANRLKLDGAHCIIGVLRKNFKILLLFNMKSWSGYGAPADRSNVDKVQLPLEARHPDFNRRFYSHIFFNTAKFLEVLIIFYLKGNTGLLFFNGGIETNSSVAATVKRGALEICLNCGNRPLRRKAFDVKTRQWYMLRVSVNRNEGLIRMNNGDAMQIMCPARSRYVPRRSLYVGGAGLIDWTIISGLTGNNKFLPGMIDTLTVNDAVVTYKMATLIDQEGWVNSLGYSLADHVTELYLDERSTITLKCGVPRQVKDYHFVRFVWLKNMKRALTGYGSEIFESDSLNQSVSTIILKASDHFEGVFACIMSKDGILVNLHVFVLSRYTSNPGWDFEGYIEWILFGVVMALLFLCCIPLLVYYLTRKHPFWQRAKRRATFWKKQKAQKPLIPGSDASSMGATTSSAPSTSAGETSGEESTSLATSSGRSPSSHGDTTTSGGTTSGSSGWETPGSAEGVGPWAPDQGQPGGDWGGGPQGWWAPGRGGGPGAGQYGPGAGQYGPGAGQYGPGAGQYGPDAGQYGFDAGQGGLGTDPYGYDAGQGGLGPGQYGPGAGQGGLGPGPYGPGAGQGGLGPGPYGPGVGQGGLGPGQFGPGAGQGGPAADQYGLGAGQGRFASDSGPGRGGPQEGLGPMGAGPGGPGSGGPRGGGQGREGYYDGQAPAQASRPSTPGKSPSGILISRSPHPPPTGGQPPIGPGQYQLDRDQYPGPRFFPGDDDLSATLTDGSSVGPAQDYSFRSESADARSQESQICLGDPRFPSSPFPSSKLPRQMSFAEQIAIKMPQHIATQFPPANQFQQGVGAQTQTAHQLTQPFGTQTVSAHQLTQPFGTQTASAHQLTQPFGTQTASAHRFQQQSGVQTAAPNLFGSDAQTSTANLIQHTRGTQAASGRKSPHQFGTQTATGNRYPRRMLLPAGPASQFQKQSGSEMQTTGQFPQFMGSQTGGISTMPDCSQKNYPCIPICPYPAGTIFNPCNPCDPYSLVPPCYVCPPCQPCFMPPDVYDMCASASNNTIRHVDFLRNPYYLSGSLKPSNLNQNNPDTNSQTLTIGSLSSDTDQHVSASSSETDHSLDRKSIKQLAEPESELTREDRIEETLTSLTQGSDETSSCVIQGSEDTASCSIQGSSETASCSIQGSSETASALSSDSDRNMKTDHSLHGLDLVPVDVFRQSKRWLHKDLDGT